MNISLCFNKAFKSFVCACMTKKLIWLEYFLEHLRFEVMMILQFACSYVSFVERQKVTQVIWTF